MGKLKNIAIGTALSLKALLPTTAEAQSKVGTFTDLDFKLSTKIWKFRPFVTAGVQISPTKNTITSIDHGYDPRFPDWERAFLNTPTAFSYGSGIDFTIRNTSAIAGFERFRGKDYEAYNRYIGLSQKIPLSNDALLRIYLKHIEGESRIEKSVNAFADYFRRGFRIGLQYEREINPKLSWNAKFSFTQSFRSMLADKDFIDHSMHDLGPSSIFTLGAGLHYNFRPTVPDINLDWGGGPPQKRQKVRPPATTPRHKMVPCPPSFNPRQRPWERSR